MHMVHCHVWYGIVRLVSIFLTVVAAGIGKIFHPGSSSGGPTKDEGGGDMPYSWSQPYFFCDQFTNDTVQSTAMQHFPNGTGCVQSEECIEVSKQP